MHHWVRLVNNSSSYLDLPLIISLRKRLHLIEYFNYTLALTILSLGLFGCISITKQWGRHVLVVHWSPIYQVWQKFPMHQYLWRCATFTFFLLPHQESSSIMCLKFYMVAYYGQSRNMNLIQAKKGSIY